MGAFTVILGTAPETETQTVQLFINKKICIEELF